jgi:hypothetical protein
MSDREIYYPERYQVRRLTDRITGVIHPHGAAYLSLDKRSGWLTITDLDVDRLHRGNGIGQNLLRFSKELAGQLDARLIIMSIISRESLDAVTAVFGEEYITVNQRGEYMRPDSDEIPDGPVGTSAVLQYPVSS